MELSRRPQWRRQLEIQVNVINDFIKRVVGFLKNRMLQVTFERSIPSKMESKSNRFIFEACGNLENLLASSRLALMAGFQPAGDPIPIYLLEYFRQLKLAGFYVVFINANPDCAPLMPLPPGLDSYCVRENVGHDFGSWGDFARCLSERKKSLTAFDEVLLCNDSVIGPLSGLDDIFARARGSKGDVVGLTDSFEVEHHLQSYFLFFKSPALLFLQSFLADSPYYRNKRLLIWEMEVGLSRKLTQNKLSWEALFSYEQLSTEDLPADEIMNLTRRFGSKGITGPKNPTHVFAEALIARLGFPFVKKELITKNPRGLLGASRLKQMLEDRGFWPTQLAGDARHSEQSAASSAEGREGDESGAE